MTSTSSITHASEPNPMRRVGRRVAFGRTAARPALLIAAAVATVAVGVLVPTSSASAAATARGSSCKPVYFVGSRGSGERLTDGPTVGGKKTMIKRGDPRYGMGPTVQRVFGEWQETLDGIDVGTMYNTYTAASTDLLKKPPAKLVSGLRRGRLDLDAATTYWFSGVRPYLASVDLGRGVLVTMLTNRIRSCPNTKFVLAGYSQGAMATHQVLRDLKGTKAGAAIIGVFLVGDGDRYNTDAHTYGTAPDGAWGIRTTIANTLKFVRPRPADVLNTAITAEICNRNDIVCDFGFGAFGAGDVHGSYSRSGDRAIPDAVDGMSHIINPKIGS